LNPGQKVSLNVEFNPTITGSASGQLTITSNSSSNPTVVVSLSGTGTSHQVDLSWNPPSASPDPVAGYHVYRAPSGSTSYQLLNTSSDVQTTYADTTVQSGQAYDYVVKSVDASGVESAPSNTTSVTIP
jgi:fibronectin type 3 domain-containing protein